MLRKDDPEQQLVYYQSGIGSEESPEIGATWREWGSNMIDSALAASIEKHVLSTSFWLSAILKDAK
jgi:uncharacterized protein (DUF2235 family)